MKKPPTEKQLAAGFLFEKRQKVLTKFLKRVPVGAALARELATIKTLEARGYTCDFLLNEVSIPFLCNFMTFFMGSDGKDILASAKLRAGLKFESSPDIILEPTKIGEDHVIERKMGLKEFLT